MYLNICELKLKEIKGDRVISVRHKHNDAILFTALFENGIEKRADVAELIKKHFAEYNKIVNVEFTEKRYTSFKVIFNDKVREFYYSLERHYIVN